MLELSTSIPTITSPEAELLLCCARTHMDAERGERISALLQQSIDWRYLLQTAASHAVLPLLYRSLNDIWPEAVPPAILHQLRLHALRNARRNLALVEALLQLMDMFTTQGIRAIPFKGLVLAAVAYGDLTLRQFGDLDFLVHPRDFLRATDLLLAQGYRLTLQLRHERHFAHEQRAVIVDLQQGITVEDLPFHFDFECLWRDRGSVAIGETLVPVLPLEDTLIFLSVKMAEDWSQRRYHDRLLQICDIAELLHAHPEIEWARTMQQAKALGSQRILLLGLCLARELLGTALPQEVLRRIQKDVAVGSLVAQIRTQPFDDPDRTPTPLETTLFRLRIRERFRERALLYAGLVHHYRWMTPHAIDQALWQFPAPLTFLYAVLWPFRLLGKYGLTPLRRLLRRIKRVRPR